ncbi:MAG: hypothetical protein KAG37_09390 [Flavobacteriales bacterium]|nr:hypothetical protein [Flavobacteriales bacterium]
MILKLTIITILIFAFNIPFGYWRENVKKFSFQWALAVHIPVPFIILIRIYADVGFAWYTYVLFVGAFFLGHRLGATLLKRRIKSDKKVSSCLIMDLIKNRF